MNRRYRKTYIIGNWKMNMTPSETKAYAEEFKTLLPKQKWCDVGFCVPAVNLYTAFRAFHDTRVVIGAENMHYETSGAFTGEISAPMIKDIGAKYVIVGHSERRQLFGETDVMVNKKVHAAIDADLIPIVCVGESLEQREAGVTMELIDYQVKAAIANVQASALRRVVIAYEPIWAIGTGKTATGEQANEVCTRIRTIIRKLYDARHSRGVSILYGGSMNADNAKDLLSYENIDGGLIGGASLNPQKMIDIVNAAKI